MVEVGTTLANKYELIEELSSTPSSIVFIAKNKNQSNSEDYVVKVVPESKQDQHGIYENEVRMLKEIQHSNIVKLLDTGRCPEYDVFYMVMPYIDGTHFDDWCRSDAEGEYDRLCCSIKTSFKLLDALELLHQKGFIHKDIKPSNILVEEDGEPYLLDFGISRAVETLTTQSQHYSPAYFSPEEINRDEVTATTDIYKLGITLIESALEEDNAKAFQNNGLSLEHAIKQVSSDDETVQNILIQMTAVDVSERYQNVRELRKALKEWFGYAEEYALVWTNNAKTKASNAFNCPVFELNKKVESSLQGSVFAEWQDDKERGSSITVTTDNFFMRLKPDSSEGYFTIVDYRDTGDERLKQYGARLEHCQFQLPNSSRGLSTSFNETSDLIEYLQSIEVNKQSEKEKQKERKSFLEQANAYQKAQREVFEKKRFRPFMVKVKTNRGKQELVCTLQDGLTITEDYFPYPESQANIGKQLKTWGIDDKGSCVQQLNNFITKKQIYSNWLKSLMQPLEKSAFPDVKKLPLSQHAREEDRQKKALQILLHLFECDLKRPKENTYLPEQGCEIGFFESDPSRVEKHEQLSPILYGELEKPDASRRAITLKYTNAKQYKINDGDLGWIGHFSIREESQLKKQEDALKALEENKGIQEKLLETLVKVEHLPLRNHEAMVLDSYITEQLDDNQKKAVAKCVLLESGQFAVLQGPPGTGKTTVITEVIQQILKHYPKAKVLVASQSHQAVDNVLEKICDEARIVRLGDDERLKGKAKEHSYTQITKKMLDDIKKAVQQEASYLDEQTLDSVSPEELSKLETLRAGWVKRLSGRDSHLETLLFKSVQVVFGTLVGMAANKYNEVNQVFDYVIIDEAGKAILSELAICMNRGQRVILVGDHKQLPPILDEESLSLLDKSTEQSLKTTFFEELYERLKQLRPEYCHTLTNNYRMHASICQLISRLFYDEKLETPEVLQRKHGLGFQKAWYWLDTSSLSSHFEKSAGAGRYYNPCHIQYIESLLDDLEMRCKKTSQEKTVAVIAPYRESIQRLKRQIKVNDEKWGKLHIEIATVDSFQGRDRDIVILDSVRSNQKKNIGFVADAARLNVALSRAKELQFVIGDAETLFEGRVPKDATNPYPPLIEYIRKNKESFSWVELKEDKGVADVQ